MRVNVQIYTMAAHAYHCKELRHIISLLLDDLLGCLADVTRPLSERWFRMWAEGILVRWQAIRPRGVLLI